jgi:hypothetical protein
VTPRLDDVARDAGLLDALAAGRSVDDPDVALLCALRQSIDEPGSVMSVPRLVPRGRRRVTVVLTAMLLSSSIGVAAAATTSHPGDLLYPVHRVVLGRTADDPTAARVLLQKAQTVVHRAQGRSPLDPAARAHALALVSQVEQHLPALHESDAEPLRRGAEEIRRIAAGPATTGHARHHRHHRPVEHPAPAAAHPVP